jgi:hypothetical protein
MRFFRQGQAPPASRQAGSSSGAAGQGWTGTAASSPIRSPFARSLADAEGGTGLAGGGGSSSSTGPLPGLTYRTGSRSNSPSSTGSQPGGQQQQLPPSSSLDAKLSSQQRGGGGAELSARGSARPRRRRHLCLLLLLLLPALTGLGVMLVRLSSSEEAAAAAAAAAAQHGTQRATLTGRFGVGGSGSGASLGWTARLTGGEALGTQPFAHLRTYQELKLRNAERLPRWAKSALKRLQSVFKQDPILAHVLPEGPWQWCAA